MLTGKKKKNFSKETFKVETDNFSTFLCLLAFPSAINVCLTVIKTTGSLSVFLRDYLSEQTINTTLEIRERERIMGTEEVN